MCKKTTILVAFMAVLSLIPLFLSSATAAWPEKPVTLYCAFSPGGSLDACTRALAEGLQQTLGQPFVVVTKDGGSGTVAMSVLEKDKPDGYTLAVATSTGLIRIPQQLKVTYKPLTSFTNIFAFAAPPSGLFVKPDSPFKTLKDAVEFAKKNPGQFKYSTAGAGTPMHMIMAAIGIREKIDWVHVPFKGSAPAETAAMGGHVDAVSSGDMDKVLSGQLRAIAVYTKDRYFRVPNVPTTVELGYPIYNSTLFSLHGPAGLDPAIVKKLEDAMEKALTMPAWTKVVESFGVVTIKMRSTEYQKFIEESWPQETELQKSLGLITEPATAPK